MEARAEKDGTGSPRGSRETEAKPSAVQALYRENASQPWRDVEIVGIRSDGLLLREVGRLFPGVWIAGRDQVRLPGVVFELRGTQRKAA